MESNQMARSLHFRHQNLPLRRHWWQPHQEAVQIHRQGEEVNEIKKKMKTLDYVTLLRPPPSPSPFHTRVSGFEGWNRGESWRWIFYISSISRCNSILEYVIWRVSVWIFIVRKSINYTFRRAEKKNNFALERNDGQNEMCGVAPIFPARNSRDCLRNVVGQLSFLMCFLFLSLSVPTKLSTEFSMDWK